MNTYQIYSAQTGDTRGRILAESEDNALDLFAQQRGYADRHDMWDRNQGLAYMSAYEVQP